MSKRKKFKTRDEIIAKIDSVLASQSETSHTADESKQLADELFAESAKPTTKEAEAWRLIHEAQEARNKQRKALKKLRRFPQRLEALKRTLAAFDTEPMPFAPGGMVMQS